MTGNPYTYPATRSARPLHLPPHWTGYDLHLNPLPDLTAYHYPSERIRLVHNDDGDVHAYPLTAPHRPWVHRNPGRPHGLGDLCLWYPDDPDSLRWKPEDGLTQLIGIVHRHLIAEEYHRRTGDWPAEAAPHGHPPTWPPHPIRSDEMRHAAITWARAS